MEIEKAINIICEILDICSQLDEETLNEACSGIYNDINAAKSIESINISARELMIFINDAPWESMDGGEDLKGEIENLYNQFLEEYEEF